LFHHTATDTLGENGKGKPAMDISLGLYPDAPASDLLTTIRLAEASGFAGIWLADSHLLWRESHVLLGAAAVQTDRVRLATCVTNPHTRHPTVTAAAFITLAEMAAGRVTLGISVGDSALRTMGMKPASMAGLARCVQELRALFAGHRITPGDGSEATLGYGAGTPIPIAVAASGPKMLRLAGAIADEVILMNGVAPDLIRAASALVDAGAREAGRDPDTVRHVVWAACHASHDDPGHSIAMCRYNVARAIQRTLPGMDDARTLQIAEEVRARYDYTQHGSAIADVAELIPDDLVPRFTFAGTPDAVRDQVRELATMGVDEVALAIPLDPGSRGRDSVVDLVAHTLIDDPPPQT
jgi:5,10-methylenetetrahydromethanopterin reductase